MCTWLKTKTLKGAPVKTGNLLKYLKEGCYTCRRHLLFSFLLKEQQGEARNLLIIFEKPIRNLFIWVHTHMCRDIAFHSATTFFFMRGSAKKHTTDGAGWNLKNRYILAFFQGLLVSTLFYTDTESRYETALFDHIITSIKSLPANTQHEDSFLLQSMHVTHALLSNRQPLFNMGGFTGFKTDINPVTFDLMTANGACGSFSRVLARILQNGGVQVRFAEMVVNNQPGGHIIIEAKTIHGWVVLDPLYDLHFTTPRQTLAGFADVQQNWAWYARQTPANYNHSYNYAGVQYTNWNKIPVLLPAIKQVLQWVIGKERTLRLSLRTYFLQPYCMAFWCTLVMYLFVAGYTFRRLVLCKG